MKEFSKILNLVKKAGLFPNVPVLQSPHFPEVLIDGKKYLMFATNNYLGLMHDQRVVEAGIRGLRKWGIGNGSARLLTGNLEMHKELEDKIAKFKKRQGGLTFVSGYMANSGSIPALVNVLKPSLMSLWRGEVIRDKGTVVFSDEYNHASVIAGIRLSGAKKEIYEHVNVDDLEYRLKKYPKKTRKLIISDGVFSMDGDIAPLPDILTLAKKYKAMVYIDDAHATGILGDNGRGVEDYFKVEGEVDVVMGTFTKSFGGVGGFIVGSNDLVDYLKITSDTFIFTAPIAPPVVFGLIEAIGIAEEEDWRRKKVVENADYLRKSLLELGCNLCNSETQIVPLLVGDENKAIKLSEELLKRKIFIPAARWPAVPKGKARLRMTLSCDHTKEHIDSLINAMVNLRKKINF